MANTLNTETIMVKDIKKGNRFLLYGAIVFVKSDAKEKISSEGFYLVQYEIESQHISTNTNYCDLLAAEKIGNAFITRHGSQTLSKILD